MATYFGFEPHNKSPYLFVSYNTEDASRIAPITMHMNQSYIPLWYDRALCAGGETWEQQIAEKIDSSEGLLMFITKGVFQKAKNSFVHVEYKLAKVFSNKPIYVVLLDKIDVNEIPLDMRVWWLELTSNQCIICYGDETDEHKAAEIIRNLKHKLHDTLAITSYENKSSLGYAVDIVFCICASSSMSPFSEAVKNTCLKFPDVLSKEMNKQRKNISQIRTRLISFHSYDVSRESAIMVTDFFDIPQHTSQYQATVNEIDFSKPPMYYRGSNALEALAYAIRSKWAETSGRKRQVIILWTNEEVAPLGHSGGEGYYPKGMASDLNQLKEWWCKMDQSGRRLIIFAPNEHGDLLYAMNEWDRSIILPISLSTMGDERCADICRMICASI